jgi:hypothetical protein
MKKLLFVMLIAMACLGASTQDANAVGVYGIWWMPDDSDDDGWGIGIKDRKNFTPLVAIDMRISYVGFSSADIIPIEATGLVKLGMLYGGVGVGYYIFTGDNDLSSTIGWYLMAGIELLPGPVQVFGEVKWQSLQPDLDIPAGGDVNLDAIVLHAGVAMGKVLP